MKFFKSAIAILFLLIYSIGFVANTVPVFGAQTYYAQIAKGSQVFLYSTQSIEDENKIFALPSTYFVELLKSASDEFYYARYNDIYGYVLKNEVKPVKAEPSSPFLTNINFRVFVPSGANLRSSPYNNGTLNLLYAVPFLDTNLMYYGISYGEEAISKKGSIWYYCKYFTGNTTYNGYIYAPLCDELSKISENTEAVEYLESISFEEETPASGEVFKGLSSTATTLIIIAISLPCLLFIYLLFKPTRLAEQTSSESSTPRKKRNKSKIKRLKNSDYFEFDDDF